MDDRADDDLMARVADGDPGAFGALFDRHYGRVYHFAATMLGDGPGAEEVLQEAFLAAARSAGSYRPAGRFAAWLMGIVRNRCLNRIDADARRRETPSADLTGAPAADRSPGDLASADETIEIVRAALAALPERQREAMTLYAFDQLTYREVATVLEMPVGTVKTLIHRARAALAVSLGPMRRENGGEL
jgi:RNA polymerase sigma-70 factor (ECF subfamily)